MIETYLKEEEINGSKVFKTYTKIENLKFDPQNPRDITEEKKIDLQDFVSKYGALKPILVDVRPDREGQIIGGNKRLEAYQKLGVAEVWIEPRDPMTDAQAFEMGTIDNMEFGFYVEAKLAAIVKQYEGELDLAKLGVHIGKIPTFEEMLKQMKKDAEEDEVPLVEEGEAVSKPGEVYQLGRHKLMCGDATKIEDVQKLAGDIKVDMIFTDPPYNIAYQGKTKERLTIENDSMSSDEFYTFLFDSFTNMHAVSKSGAVIYICHADMERVNFQRAMQDSGWQQKQNIIWAKQHFVLGRQDYQWQHEPILYGWKEGEGHYFNGGRTETTVWNVDRPTASIEHPTMKPIALVVRALNNSTKGGDIVLDTFAGSGSTLIACEQTDRNCLTMELDPHYCDVIRKRYANYIKADNWELATPAIPDVPTITPGVDPGNIQPEQQQETA